MICVKVDWKMGLYIDIGATWTRVGTEDNGYIKLVKKLKTSEFDICKFKDVRAVCGAGRLVDGRLHLPNLNKVLDILGGSVFINDNEAYAYGVASLRKIDLSKTNLFVKVGTGVGVSVSIPFREFVVLSTEAGHSTSIDGKEWEFFLGGKSLGRIMRKEGIKDRVENFFLYAKLRRLYLDMFKSFLRELMTYYNVTGRIYLGGSVIVNNEKWFRRIKVRVPRRISMFYNPEIDIFDDDLLNLEGLRYYIELKRL